jgi:hypothetical protein
MSHAQCADFQEAAAELALGTLTGRERATALAHVDGCNTCGRHLETLAHTADMLFLSAPDAEPPAGLSDRILAQFRRDHHPRPRLPRIAIAAAIALLVGASSATATLIAGNRRPTHDVAASAQAVQISRFNASTGEHVTGEVFSQPGDHRPLFMVVHDTTKRETYTCELTLSDGRLITIGSFALHDGVAVWGRTLDFDTNRIRRVRLLDSEDAIAATATIR